MSSMFVPPPPQTNMIRLKHDSAQVGQMSLASYNPNSRLSGSITDDGTGISLSVTGGWSSSDPFDGVYITWDLKDAFGNSVDVTKNWQADLLLVERTPPGLSSDTIIVAGIMNERQDSATMDAHFGGIRYTAASRNVHMGGILNGAAGSISDGGAIADIRQVFISGARINGVRGDSTLGVPLLSDGTRAGGSTNNGSSAGGFTFLATGTPTIFVAVYRSAVTAGTETVKFDVYLRPFLQSAKQI